MNIIGIIAMIWLFFMTIVPGFMGSWEVTGIIWFTVSSTLAGVLILNAVFKWRDW